MVLLLVRIHFSLIIHLMLQVKVIVGRRMCGGGWISNVLNFYELHLKPGVTIDNNIRYLLCQA